MGLSGTQHMLKALGIDPAEIMQGIEAFKKTVLEVKAAQERVEIKLDRILNAVERDADAPSKDVDEVLDHLALMPKSGDTTQREIYSFPDRRTGPTTIAEFDDSQITTEPHHF
jgi:uncharacterized protein YhaN